MSQTIVDRLGRERLLEILRQMIRIRRFEERTAELYAEMKIRGFLHLYIGEEAVACGVIPFLNAEDAIVSTYREHGHILVRGTPMDAVMAELYGKVEGCSKGRGGSMHLYDAGRRFYGGNAIVGGGIPMAVGLALADKMQGHRRIAACFFGEGAMAEGEFHESMNLASLWKLPVLFCCENNLYAMGTHLVRSEAETDLCLKARSYHIEAHSVDGMDLLACAETSLSLMEKVRNEMRPIFVEFKTYRFRPHSMFDPELYRNKSEVSEWKKRDPIPVLTEVLKQRNWLTEELLKQIESQINTELEQSVRFAEQGSLEPWEETIRDVTTPHIVG